MNKPIKGFLDKKVSISRLLLGVLFLIVALISIHLIRFVYREVVPAHETFQPAIPYMEISTTSSRIQVKGAITAWSFKNQHECSLDSGRRDCNIGINTYTLNIDVRDQGKLHSLEKKVQRSDFRREPAMPVSQVNYSEFLDPQMRNLKKPSRVFYLPERQAIVMVRGLDDRWPENYYREQDIAPLAVEKNSPIDFSYLLWKDGKVIERERRRYLPRMEDLNNDTLVKGALLSLDGPETDQYLGFFQTSLVKSIELVEAQARIDIAALLQETRVPEYREVQLQLFSPRLVPDQDADWRPEYEQQEWF